MIKMTLSSAIKIAGLIIIGGLIIWGFLIIGSPGRNRKLANDQARIDDLRSIKTMIDDYYDTETKLPDDLSSFENSLDYQYINFYDPLSNTKYGYRKLSEKEYELSAVFDLSSDDAMASLYNPTKNKKTNPNGEEWNHGIGSSRFVFTVPFDEPYYD